MSFDKKAWSVKRYQERKAELAARRASPEWKAKRKEWATKHRNNNREQLNELDRARHRANPKHRRRAITKEQKSRWDSSYRLRHRMAIKTKSARYYASNKDAFRKRRASYMKKKLATDPAFRLLHNLRARVRVALSNNSGSGRVKAARTMELIGCDIPTLRAHIEKQFKPGMTWENHGLRGWHIDHRKACSLYDLTDPAQQRECFHFSNMQPLWWRANISKGNKTLCV